MKNHIKSIYYLFTILLAWSFAVVPLAAQDEMVSETEDTTKDLRPVKNTFEGMWIIDNQTVMVPIKGSFEFAIQHRFGTIENGYDDFWGLFAPSNIRLGFGYSPVEKLMVGFGFTKYKITWDFNAKYALLKQARKGGSPVSLTYYGNVAIDTRDKENFVNASDRYSFFNQLILARKISDKLSVQVSPSWSHYNAVEGYYDENEDVQGKMENDHIAIAVSGRYKVSNAMSIIANYDQPITQHYTNNPNPNISFGLEIGTSSHTFQIFAGNYYNIVPQANNMFNSNNYEDGEFLIGFNITRLWN
jgi:hypothetical protein